MLIIDETGFIKKGTESVGVKRQYTGTTGKIDNCQIGVFLCQATESGTAFLDRKLYLPKEWALGTERRRKAGIRHRAAPKGRNTRRGRVCHEARAGPADAGPRLRGRGPRHWVTGDSVYGASRTLRRWLEEQKQPFVLAVPSNESLWTGPIWEEGQVQTAAEISAGLPTEAFRRLSAPSSAPPPRGAPIFGNSPLTCNNKMVCSANAVPVSALLTHEEARTTVEARATMPECQVFGLEEWFSTFVSPVNLQVRKMGSAGNGSKGEQLYDWALVPLWRLQMTAEERAWSHAVLIRRSRENPNEETYYVVFASREEASLDSVVPVAGMRWRIEEGFKQAKDVCGLDEYEVRKYEAWHRHITMSLLAHAFLATVVARERKKGTQQSIRTLQRVEELVEELIPLTAPEAQRLMERLLWKKVPCVAAVVHWSLWRRHHQRQAQKCHYWRRSANFLPAGALRKV